MSQPIYPNPLQDAKCGPVHHHVRNGMQVILAHLHTLERKTPATACPEIRGIHDQIARMTAALAGCSVPNHEVPS